VVSKERFTNVRQLIAAKRYGEARLILEDIDHLKAQEWLWRLDKIEGKHRRNRRLKLIGGLVVLILIAGGALSFVALRAVRDFDDDIACLNLPESVWDACQAAGGYTEYMQSRP